MPDDEQAERKLQSDRDAENNVRLGFPENFGGTRCRLVESGHDCPHCGFVFVPLPAWVEVRWVERRLRRSVFALHGVIYRCMAIGSTNRRGGQWSCHFSDVVTCQPVDEANWHLPNAPSAKSNVASALKEFYALPMFFGTDLKDALHVASEQSERLSSESRTL